MSNSGDYLNIDSISDDSQPLKIVLGRGQVSTTLFHFKSSHGLIFRDTGIVHRIGEDTNEGLGEHSATTGELYVQCLNRESAMVLLDMVQRVVDSFE